jgi:hypothetical protein
MSAAQSIASELIAMHKDYSEERIAELINGKARLSDHAEILSLIDGHQSSNETNAVLLAQALLGDADALERCPYYARNHSPAALSAG